MRPAPRRMLLIVAAWTPIVAAASAKVLYSVAMIPRRAARKVGLMVRVTCFVIDNILSQHVAAVLDEREDAPLGLLVEQAGGTREPTHQRVGRCVYLDPAEGELKYLRDGERDRDP